MKLPNVNKILLDMDGPLVDDFAMFKTLDPTVVDMHLHIAQLKVFGLKQQYVFPLIEKAIDKGLFAKAKPTLFTVACKNILIPYWESLGIEVEILSSTMKENNKREQLLTQKRAWLEERGLGHLKANFCEGSALKQEYAKEGVLLIDDYDRTIGQFIAAGGYGIQYRNLTETMEILRAVDLAPKVY